MAKIWIGFDGSDIEGSPYFSGAIVSYGPSTDCISSFCADTKKRIGHFHKDEIDYVSERMACLVREDENVRFVFSNQHESRHFKQYAQHVVCCNPVPLLSLLNSKVSVRAGFRGVVSMLPYASLPAGMITWKRVRSLYPGVELFIIQAEAGAGGTGSHLISDSTSLSRVLSGYSCSDTLSLSPLISPCISVNQTLVVGRESCLCLQPSIQMIEQRIQYSGTSFSTYRDLPLSVHRQIETMSNSIARELERLNYRGIVGVDYLVDSETAYFNELNPRFQGSSFLLDRLLYRKNGVGLYDLNERAFSQTPFSQTEEALYSSLVLEGESINHVWNEPGDETEFLNDHRFVSDGADVMYDFYEKGVFLCREFVL